MAQFLTGFRLARPLKESLREMPSLPHLARARAGGRCRCARYAGRRPGDCRGWPAAFGGKAALGNLPGSRLPQISTASHAELVGIFTNI